MTIKNKFSFIGIAALLICFAVIFFNRHKIFPEKVFIHAEAVQTAYGWGYIIYRSHSDELNSSDKKIFIKQDFMPAVPGNQGFKSAADALLVGNLVIKKISSNQLPSVSVKELDSLGLTYK
jgi:hypothetical protein